MLYLILFLPLFSAGLASILRARLSLLLGVGVQVLQFILILALFFSIGKDLGTGIWDSTEKLQWFSLGEGTVHFQLMVDGANLSLIAISAIVFIAAFGSALLLGPKSSSFSALMLFLSFATTGTFLAADIILFFFFFELMLLPMYFLIAKWGGEGKAYAALKFLLYTLFGSLFVLAAFIIIGLQQGGDFSLLPSSEEEVNLWKTSTLGTIAFFLLLIGFGVKLPIVPFHTWLPNAHVEAPTPVSIVLAGIMLKIGGYGLFRFVFLLFPVQWLEWQSVILAIGVISLLWGSLMALAQTDLKSLVAYSSVGHMGFVVLGLGAATQAGLNGAYYQMLAHGVISPMLFLLVGFLYHRYHTRNIADFAGLASAMPKFTFWVGWAFFAGLGLPLFGGFIAELMVLSGLYQGMQQFQYSPWVFYLALPALLLAAGYFLWAFKRMFFGEFWFVGFQGQLEKNPLPDLNRKEIFWAAFLGILALLMGIFPNYFLGWLALALPAY